jgi:hypothetical protein
MEELHLVTSMASAESLAKNISAIKKNLKTQII